MPSKIACPKCESTFRITDKHRGKRVVCPKCQAAFRVPEKPQAEGVPPAEDPYLQGLASRFEQDEFLIFKEVDSTVGVINLVATKPRRIGPQWTEEYFVIETPTSPSLNAVKSLRQRAWEFALANENPMPAGVKAADRLVRSVGQIISPKVGKVVNTQSMRQLSATISLYSVSIIQNPTEEIIRWVTGKESAGVNRTEGYTRWEVSLVWDPINHRMHQFEKIPFMSSGVYKEARKVIQQRLTLS